MGSGPTFQEAGPDPVAGEGMKLQLQEKEFYKRIEEILYYKWDPIGISDSAWPRDEYQSYLPQVFKRALAGGSPHPIAAYLGQIRTEYMGLPENIVHDLKIAVLILEIKEELDL